MRGAKSQRDNGVLWMGYVITCCLLLLFMGCGKKKQVEKKPSLLEEEVTVAPQERKVAAPETPVKNSPVVFKNDDVKIKNWDGDKKDQLKVEYSKDNVLIIDGPPPAPPTEKVLKRKKGKITAPEIFETPRKTRAYALLKRVKERYITWTPKWHFIGRGEVRLPDYVLSRDQSLLCIVETIGKKEGPFGTRFIFINTYNWRVINIITDVKHNVSHVKFIPHTNLLLCWGEKQTVLHQPYLLYSMRIHNGNIVAQSAPFKNDISDMFVSPSGKRTIIKLKGSPLLLSLPTGNLKKNIIEFKSKSDSGKVMFIPRRNRIVLAGNKKLEILTHNLQLRKTLSYPSDFHPTAMSYSPDTNEIFLSEQYKKTYALISDVFQEMIGTLSGKWIYYNPAEKTLYLSLAKLGEVRPYIGEEHKEEKPFFLSKLRPKTKGEVNLFVYLKHRKSFLCIDSDGNIYTLYRTKRNWKKFLLIVPKR